MERADLEQWKAREVARLLALVETERRYYQEIVATVPVGLIVLSRDLTVLSANRAFRQTFGFRSQDVLRRQLDEILPIEGLHTEIVEVLETGTPQANRFFEMQQAGASRLLRIGIQRIRSWSDEGEEEALLSVEDFSGIEGYGKLVEAPAALPDPREQVAAVVWEADPSALRFTYVNQMAEELLGYPVEEWTKDSNFWTRRLHPDDRDWLNDFYRRAAGAGVSHRCEYRAVRADGGVVWLRDIVRVSRADDGRAEKFSGVSIDITERRGVEEQILEAQKFDSVSRVIGKAAHGFNNLLMIIGGYGDQLLSGLSPDDPLRADIEEILRATARVSDVSAQLQSFTRRPASHPKEFSAAEFLKMVEPKLQPALPKNVKLSVAAQAELKIKADPVQLEQILRSFVSQSVRGLTEGGNLSIQAKTIELGEDYGSPRSTLRPGTHAAIVIRDDGQGLDAESRRKLFEPAFGQPETPGGPVAVASAYGLLRQNGGDVMVQSSAGEGCEFRLLFPLLNDSERLNGSRPPAEERPASKAVETEPKLVGKLEPPQPPAQQEFKSALGPRPVDVKPIEAKTTLRAPAAPKPEPPQVRVAPPPPVHEPTPQAPVRPVDSPKALLDEVTRKSARTVLVVEDEAGIRMLMRKILDRQGYNVIEATRGDEALQIVQSRKTPVQLLVTDLVMPQMSGRELAERLTRTQPSLKVLYVSGFTDDEAIRSGSLGPGSAFLQKPFTLGSLVEKVREVLGEEQRQ